MENPIKMDDLGVPLFLETPIKAKVTSVGCEANIRLIPTYVFPDTTLRMQSCLERDCTAQEINKWF